MADHFQFGAFQPSAGVECRRCEELLADAAEHLLAPADQVFFEEHIATCGDCSASFADARRGAAWLEMLKTPRPEPSAQLFERILSRTSGAQISRAQSRIRGEDRPDIPYSAVPAPSPAVNPLRQPPASVSRERVLPFRARAARLSPNLRGFNRLLFEPRLAMTAAMAFFSIALTLNLAGVRLNQLHAQDLGPAGLRRTYFQATASVARHYEGLRVVHTFESRVDDLRQNNLNPDDQNPDDQDGKDVNRSDPGRPSRDAGPDSLRAQPATPAPKSQPPMPQPKTGKASDGGVSRRELKTKLRLLAVLDGEGRAGKLQTTMLASLTML